MLYVTTRGDRDAFTAHRTLLTDSAPDCGLFIPMRFPQLSEKEIREITSASFEACIARILNTFFSSEITQWDVAFCIGRNSARISEMNPKIYCAEIWHNSGNGFDYILNGLFQRVAGQVEDRKPTEWFRIVVKIAIIFGIYGDLCKQGFISYGDAFDFSLVADDFSYPTAALYAAKMGLPIGDLVCNFVQTNSVWNFFHRGELDVSGMALPLKAGIERLLLLRLGEGAVEQLGKSNTLKLLPEEQAAVRVGLFCSVLGSERSLQAMKSVYSYSGRILAPDAALCIAGLGDYRAKTGECKYTLVIEEDSPVIHTNLIKKAIGLTTQEIDKHLKE